MAVRSPSEAPGPVRLPGRPRSEAREHDILEAALAELVAEGYDAMTMEGVAARVGAGKATIYRRWHNKAELVIDAIRRHGCPSVPVVDTGDARADIRTFLRKLQKSFEGMDGQLIAAFAAERIRHPELSETFDRLVIAERRTRLRTIIQRGVDSGQLPADTDVDLLADVGPALMLHEFTRRQGQIRRHLADRIVDQFFPAPAGSDGAISASRRAK
jgi:AcrR family transcriptional regulator